MDKWYWNYNLVDPARTLQQMSIYKKKNDVGSQLTPWMYCSKYAVTCFEIGQADILISGNPDDVVCLVFFFRPSYIMLPRDLWQRPFCGGLKRCDVCY